MPNISDTELIYRERLLKIRHSKIADLDIDLRSKLTKNEKRRINYYTNKYEAVINSIQKDTTVARKVSKKTQKVLRKKGFLIKNDRVYVQKTKGQIIHIEGGKNGKYVNVTKTKGKRKVKIKYTISNILDDLATLKLKENQVIQLKYFGYGMSEVFDSVEDLLAFLDTYLPDEDVWDGMTEVQKNKELANYSYDIITY